MNQLNSEGDMQLQNQEYRLNSGRIINPDNLDELTKEEVIELINTQATLWDFLILRKSNHNLVNKINSILGNMSNKIDEMNSSITMINESLKNIESKLTVEISNGDNKRCDIGSVVVDLWEFHYKDREKKRHRKVLMKYKYHLLTSFMLVAIFTFIFRQKIDLVINHLYEYFIPVLTASTVLTIIITLIKYFLTKKGG